MEFEFEFGNKLRIPIRVTIQKSNSDVLFWKGRLHLTGKQISLEGSSKNVMMT